MAPRTLGPMGDVSEWLPVGLESVALRLARADQLIYELARGAFGWSSGDTPIDLGYEWVCPHRLNLVVRGVREIPPILPMLFSEAVNHLRAAIDNTVFYLVGQAHGGPLPQGKSWRSPCPSTRPNPTSKSGWIAPATKCRS